jgi:gamma-glutamyltranspeptidase/glutathione hydrolase
MIDYSPLTCRQMLRWLNALALAALLLGCAAAPVATPDAAPLQPEAATGLQASSGVRVERQAVAAAHPLAAEAGLRMLRAGGSALDAAIAAQMVLGLVEPQSSGLGGGALLLHFDGARVEAWDGRETAPAAADERLFLRPDGQAMGFHEAAVGGLAVGVPGLVAMLETAHRRHGQLPWADLFEPAIALAEQGFEVGPRLHRLLELDPYLRRDPVAARHFYDSDGHAWPIGHRLRNPELARTLRRVAAQGAAGLLQGETAAEIVAKVRQHPANPGRLSLQDLAGYRPREREPLCHEHRAHGHDWRICGFPPPSSGALALGQILGLLARSNADRQPLQDGLPGPDWLHRYTEAARLAYADRARYVADPDFVAAPGGDWLSLLDPDYLDQRARLIGERSMRVAAPGQPRGRIQAGASMAEQPEYGTSHLSVVDAQGRSLAMTSTVEDAFGARQMVAGLLLNNQLTDFSFQPRDASGQPVANRVEPGKRPRSSMTPTLVFERDSGRLLLSAGSPGGALIPHYLGKTLYGSLHWGLAPQDAADLPNFGSLNGPTLLERGRFPPATLEALRRRGHELVETDMTSGVQLLQRQDGGWLGGADPRREGVVRGD